MVFVNILFRFNLFFKYLFLNLLIPYIIYMKLIVEILFVGLYTTIIYFLFYIPFTYLNINKNLQIFIIGFLKHYLGYYIGIQSFYCNKIKQKTVALPKYLFILSILEGILFVFLSTILFKNIKSLWLTLFFTGSIMHLLAEIIGVHNYFKKNFCKTLY